MLETLRGTLEANKRSGESDGEGDGEDDGECTGCGKRGAKALEGAKEKQQRKHCGQGLSAAGGLAKLSNKTCCVGTTLIAKSCVKQRSLPTYNRTIAIFLTATPHC